MKKMQMVFLTIYFCTFGCAGQYHIRSETHPKRADLNLSINKYFTLLLKTHEDSGVSQLNGVKVYVRVSESNKNTFTGLLFEYDVIQLDDSGQWMIEDSEVSGDDKNGFVIKGEKTVPFTSPGVKRPCIVEVILQCEQPPIVVYSKRVQF